MEKRCVISLGILVLLADILLGVLFLLGSDPVLAQKASSQGLVQIVLQEQRAPITDRNLVPLTDTEEELWGFIFSRREGLDDDDLLCVRDISLITYGKPCCVPLRSLPSSGNIFPFRKTVRAGGEAIHLLGYTDGEGNGVCGLEAAFDTFLLEHGTVLSAEYRTDGTGALWGSVTVKKSPSGGGAALVTTLDRSLQEIARSAAERYIEKGAVVILDVATGDILASCSSPDYDAGSLTDAMEDENEPFNNRAFLPYNVGSVFKPVVAAAALEAGMEDFTYTCTGSITVGGTTFRCNAPAGHGTIGMEEAICHSCNPYFIALGQEVGYDAVYSMASALGFGEPCFFASGIVSSQGSLPSPQEITSPADAANICFGQGALTATPLQLARMMAAIAGGGILPPVNLLCGIEENGGITEEEMRNTGTVRVFSERTAARLCSMLATVVERGSGTSAAPNRGGAGGKTGSAQTGQYGPDMTEIVQGWFVGFYPLSAPKYAIAVVAENTPYGSTAAAPAFRWICDRIFVERGL